MRRCVFKIENLEAHYIKEYDEDVALDSGEVIVSFMNDNYKDVIHIDDGDWRCLQILNEKNMLPVITR